MSIVAEDEPECDQTLWKYVYEPERLILHNWCIRVTGKIAKIKIAADGDIHIELTLDPKYEYLVNETNKRKRAGNLIVEPICQKEAREKAAIESCKGFTAFMDIPPVGTRVEIVGSHVLDLGHGWMEIHPATRITPIPQKP